MYVFAFGYVAKPIFWTFQSGTLHKENDHAIVIATGHWYV